MVHAQHQPDGESLKPSPRRTGRTGAAKSLSVDGLAIAPDRVLRLRASKAIAVGADKLPREGKLAKPVYRWTAAELGAFVGSLGMRTSALNTAGALIAETGISGQAFLALSCALTSSSLRMRASTRTAHGSNHSLGFAPLRAAQYRSIQGLG